MRDKDVEPPTRQRVKDICKAHDSRRYVYVAFYLADGHRDITCQGPIKDDEFKKILGILTESPEKGADK